MYYVISVSILSLHESLLAHIIMYYVYPPQINILSNCSISYKAQKWKDWLKKVQKRINGEENE